jgi:hypothetical protein
MAIFMPAPPVSLLVDLVQTQACPIVVFTADKTYRRTLGQLADNEGFSIVYLKGFVYLYQGDNEYTHPKTFLNDSLQFVAKPTSFEPEWAAHEYGKTYPFSN